MRLTDNDRKFGPITYGPTQHWRPWRLVWSSGDDERPGNRLEVYAFGWVASMPMPPLLSPYRIRHKAVSWDAATVARLGRDWFEESFPRQYGFSLCDGFLQVFLGPQTDDSITTRDWCLFLPWTQWRQVRTSLYDTEGNLFWTAAEGTPFDEYRQVRGRCPVMRFEVQDYDGERVAASALIEEREMRLGKGWFKWLGWFRKRVHRELRIEFSSEVGTEKGSWKGGVMGTGISMLPGELHEAAFRRFCAQEHRAKYGAYRLTYLGPAGGTHE